MGMEGFDTSCDPGHVDLLCRAFCCPVCRHWVVSWMNFVPTLVSSGTSGTVVYFVPSRLGWVLKHQIASFGNLRGFTPGPLRIIEDPNHLDNGLFFPAVVREKVPDMSGKH